MIEWQDYLMGFAKHAATKSKDSTQVGAVLVGSDGKSVLLTAYNGPPSGVDDLACRRERPTKYLFSAHAEANLISKAAHYGIRTVGCHVYVTHAPCASCARTLIQAGVVCVVAGDGTTSMPAAEFEAAETMLSEAAVTFSRPYLASFLPLETKIMPHSSADLEAYLHRQWAWSKETFGPALRTKGVIQHITKELREIETKPHDLSEWVDVIILAMDGFWRHGGKPEDLLPAMQAKQDKNFARTWPDWRLVGEDSAIEHDRSDESVGPLVP